MSKRPLEEGDHVTWPSAGKGRITEIVLRGGVRVALVAPGGEWYWHPAGFFTREPTAEAGVPIRVDDLSREGD